MCTIEKDWACKLTVKYLHFVKTTAILVVICPVSDNDVPLSLAHYVARDDRAPGLLPDPVDVEHGTVLGPGGHLLHLIHLPCIP